MFGNNTVLHNFSGMLNNYVKNNKTINIEYKQTVSAFVIYPQNEIAY